MLICTIGTCTVSTRLRSSHLSYHFERSAEVIWNFKERRNGRGGSQDTLHDTCTSSYPKKVLLLVLLVLVLLLSILILLS